MKLLRLTTATAPVAIAFAAGLILISGCQSDPRAQPKMEREPTFGRAGEREDLEIRVQISPVEGKAHWYKMESVLIRKRRGETNSGEDRLSFPTLQAAVGANAVSYQFPVLTGQTGPWAWFKVYEQAGKLIEQYEVGYDSKGESATRKGRIELKAPGAD